MFARTFGNYGRRLTRIEWRMRRCTRPSGRTGRTRRANYARLSPPSGMQLLSTGFALATGLPFVCSEARRVRLCGDDFGHFEGGGVDHIAVDGDGAEARSPKALAESIRSRLLASERRAFLSLPSRGPRAEESHSPPRDPSRNPRVPVQRRFRPNLAKSLPWIIEPILDAESHNLAGLDDNACRGFGVLQRVVVAKLDSQVASD